MISYLTATKKLIEALQPYCKAQQIQLVNYNQKDLKKYEVLLLFSPFYKHKVYTSPERVWKTYLAKHHPSIKLITIGFQHHEHTNYLDLFQLPTDFHAFVQQAKRADEDWQPVDTGGAEMENRLERFFKGHGKDSVKRVFRQLKQTVTTAIDELEEGMEYEVVYEEVILGFGFGEWQRFVNRWSNYYHYFDYLPYYDTFQQIDKDLNIIRPLFENPNFSKKEFLSINPQLVIQNIQNQLILIEENYGRKTENIDRGG